MTKAHRTRRCYSNPAKSITIGTPHELIRDIISVFGIKSQEVDSLTLFGVRPCRPIHSWVYDNPFASYGLHDPKDPVHLTNLALHNFELSFIAPSMFTSFAISNLSKLGVKQCSGLSSLLQHFVSRKDEVRLQVLEIEVYSYYETMDPLYEDSLYNFLKGFSTLEVFYFKTPSHWIHGFVADALEFHRRLHTCIIGLGDQRMNIDCVRTVREAHSSINTFGNRAYGTRETLAGPGSLPERAAWIGTLAKEMVLFEALESWHIMCDVPKRGNFRIAKTLADFAYRQYCEAVGDKTCCKLNIISIHFCCSSYRDDEVRQGLMPEPIEFFYPRAN